MSRLPALPAAGLLAATLLAASAAAESPPIRPLPPGSYVDPSASLVGSVSLGERVYVAALGSLRGRPGGAVTVGNETNVQDGAVLVGYPDLGIRPPGGLPDGTGVRIGRRTTVAARAHVQAPAVVGDGVFLGMGTLVIGAEISDDCVLEPGAMVIGVRIPSGRQVPAGLAVIDQDAADALPETRPGSPFHDANRAMVSVYSRMAEELRRSPR